MDRRTPLSSGTTRHYLALAVLLLVALNAGVAMFVPAAREIFDKLFQVLLLVIGYYFGRR